MSLPTMKRKRQEIEDSEIEKQFCKTCNSKLICATCNDSSDSDWEYVRVVGYKGRTITLPNTASGISPCAHNNCGNYVSEEDYVCDNCGLTGICYLCDAKCDVSSESENEEDKVQPN